jgi:hypothetical protein
MRGSKGANVVAFPLSRSERIEPSRKQFKFENGKIVAIPATDAGAINFQEAAGRIQARSSAKSGASGAGAKFR